MLFFTGFSRSARNILIDQKKKSQQNDGEMIENLHFVKQLGLSKNALEAGNVKLFGEHMHEALAQEASPVCRHVQSAD